MTMGWILDGEDERLPGLWPGAVADFDPDDPGLIAALDAARIQCEAFAPVLPTGTQPPANYVAAQATQARAILRANQVGTGDQLGGYGEGVTVYPMDWQVKNLLRPKTRPVVA